MNPKFFTFPNLVLGTILLVSSVFFFSFKWVNNQWHYNIASDGKGYYIYLPAALIYHDFSFKFTDQIEAKNYLGDVQPAVAKLPDGNRLNKYFVGEALLLLPFFLMACVVSYISGLPVDGYNFIFQAAVSLAALFYVLMGLMQLKRLLMHASLSQNVIGFVLILVFAGSNLLHYSLMEPSMSHVYSFFAVTSFLSVSADFMLQNKKHQLYLMFALLAIICLIRPVNGLIVFTLPFIVLLLKIKRIDLFILRKKSIFIGIGLFFSIIFIQLFMYKLQTGHWWVWAYHNEGFNFMKAHFLEFLFSFRKGWFIYTPIALLSILLACFAWKKKPTLLFSFLAPILFIVFVASSWHDWAYGASFGSRPMTEFMGFVILPLAITLNNMQSYFKKAIIVFIAWCFLLYNCVQTYQINKYILLWDNMTFEAYKASFLKTHEQFIHMLD